MNKLVRCQSAFLLNQIICFDKRSQPGQTNTHSLAHSVCVSNGIKQITKPNTRLSNKRACLAALYLYRCVYVCVYIKIYIVLSAPFFVTRARGPAAHMTIRKKLMKWKQSTHLECELLQRGFFPQVRIYLKCDNTKKTTKKTAHAIKISTYCRRTVDSCKSRVGVATDCVYHFVCNGKCRLFKNSFLYPDFFFLFSICNDFFLFECVCLEIITLFRLHTSVWVLAPKCKRAAKYECSSFVWLWLWF